MRDLAKTFRACARILAVVGIVGASTLAAGSARATHAVVFTDCQPSSTPNPSPSDPLLTPAPTEPPVSEETPPPEPQATQSPQNCMPPSGDRIWGTRSLQFQLNRSSNERVDSVRLSIISEEANIPSANQGQPVSTWTPTDSENLFNYIWNSNEATPYNGRYKVVVVANSPKTLTRKEHTATGERTDLRVDNPPHAVGAPKVLAKTLTSVTLDWPKATELDVTGYTIYRATAKDGDERPPYSAFRPIGVTTGNAFRDSTVRPGFHWYTVKVTRRSIVTPETGISSALSPISAATEVESLKEIEKKADDGKPVPTRFIPFRDLAPPRPLSVLASVPDAPFAYKLPYDDNEAVEAPLAGAATESEGGADPRGAVLPVAVGMFLVSSALVVGRMPY
jgi:hypothetical protein